MSVKYQVHSPTSQAAAASMMQKAARLEGKVFRFLFRLGARGATDEEIMTKLGLTANTGRARRCWLYDHQLVADSGQTRLTRARRHAVVWVHFKWTPKGHLWRKSTRSVSALKRHIVVLDAKIVRLERKLADCEC